MKKIISVGSLVGIGILIAIFYILMTNQGVGVFISCENHEIISIRNIPPPLASIAQPLICKINLTVSDINGTTICEEEGNILNQDRGVIGCSSLKKHKGEEVYVNIIVFDSQGNEIGKDSDKLIVNP